MDGLGHILLALAVIVTIFGGAWLIDLVFGDGPNRRYLAQYILGTNSALAGLGIPLKNQPETREARTLIERQLVYRARSYNHSVSCYRSLAKRFGLHQPQVIIISDVRFLASNSAILTLEDWDGVHVQYSLILWRDIETTIELLSSAIYTHLDVIGRHHWGSRIFQS